MKYLENDQRTWAVEDRPETKLQDLGAKSLTDTEILSLLLQGKDSIRQARELLALADNKLSTLAHMSRKQYETVNGISKNMSLKLKAFFELSVRHQNESKVVTPVKSSESVFKIFRPIIGDLQHEEFWLLTMNRANRVISRHKISQGGMSGTVIDTRIILKHALDDRACTLIVCHNHPSGNINPSDPDVKITEKLKKAAETMELKLLDHVIVTDQAYFSFADEGLIA